MDEKNKLVNKLSFEEKIKLLSGQKFWYTSELLKENISKIRLSYGPIGITNSSVTKVSLPAPVTLASSWNKELMYDLGVYLGNQAQEAEVDALIAADLSIKRHPYYAKGHLLYGEDPVLTGNLVSHFVKGINETKTKVVLKSFTALSQESYKRSINTVVDLQALNNLYLKPFKIVLKENDVAGILFGHNRVNGVFASENEQLSNILINKFDYQGLLISEWGSINNRFLALKNGISLEMPQADVISKSQLTKSYQKGELDDSLLDYHVNKVLDFINKNDSNKPHIESKTNLPVLAVEESAVLLKNKSRILPLKETDGILILGRLASKPKIQVLGNTAVDVETTKTFLDVIKENKIMYEYSHGYYLDNNQIDNNLIAEAVNLARRQQPVILFLGLTNQEENSNIDKTNLELPISQITLLNKVAEVNKNIIVVLVSGSAVVTNWDKEAKALLYVGVAGSGFAEGVYNLLFNKTNPSGKLAETFPFEASGLPTAAFYPMGPKHVSFNESIYVGYRYFSSVLKQAKYRFGFGLSYSTFTTSLLFAPQSVRKGGYLYFNLLVTNHGPYPGQEVAKLYYSKTDSHLLRPRLELITFEKVFLNVNESKVIDIKIPYKDLEIYVNEEVGSVVEAGLYQFYTDLKLNNAAQVDVNGEVLKGIPYYHGYNYLTGLDFSYENHFKLINYPILENQDTKVGEFTFNSTISELSKTIVGKRLFKKAVAELSENQIYSKNKATNELIASQIIGCLPLRSFIKMSENDYELIYWQDFLNACNQNKLFSYFRKKSKKTLDIETNILD